MSFDQPKDVSSIDLAFGNVDGLMPAWYDIPEEFRQGQIGNKWIRFQRQWFFDGLDSKRVIEKPGVDKTKALRHLMAIQSSFEPKHEHKQAAVAWLASKWFADWEEKT